MIKIVPRRPSQEIEMKLSKMEGACWYKVIKTPDSQTGHLGTLVIRPTMSSTIIAFIPGSDVPQTWFEASGYQLIPVAGVEVTLIHE